MYVSIHVTYLSTCLVFLLGCLFFFFFFFHLLGKMLTGLTKVQPMFSHAKAKKNVVFLSWPTCLFYAVTSDSLDCILKSSSPLRTLRSVFFWWLDMLFCAYCQDPAKAFCIYFLFFFKGVPPTLKPTSSSHLLREDETKWGFMKATSTHSEGPHSHLQITYCIFFFLLWWQLCIPKWASFWWIPKKEALWRKWSFYMSLVMLYDVI